MKATDLVGKLIVSRFAAKTLNMPKDTKFKVVGYTVEHNSRVIVDAGNLGWKYSKDGDQILENCESYWLVSLCTIDQVL